MDKILVIDYGSQYNELIVRRVRDLGVYALLVDNKTDLSTFYKNEIKNYSCTPDVILGCNCIRSKHYSKGTHY